MATPPGFLHIKAQQMQEMSLGLEQAAAAGQWATYGVLLADMVGRVYESILALSDIDPNTADGVKGRIVAVGEEVFGELARADIHRDHSYDTPQLLREGSPSDTPNTNLIKEKEKRDAQRNVQADRGPNPVQAGAEEKG